MGATACCSCSCSTAACVDMPMAVGIPVETASAMDCIAARACAEAASAMEATVPTVGAGLLSCCGGCSCFKFAGRRFRF